MGFRRAFMSVEEEIEMLDKAKETWKPSSRT